MVNRLTSCPWIRRVMRHLRTPREASGTLAGMRLSLNRAQRTREQSMRKAPALPVPSRVATLLLLLLPLATAGCARQLAVHDEYFAPASGVSTRNRVEARQVVSHHRALQVAQHFCTGVPDHSRAPPENAQVSAGPEVGSLASDGALRRLCASISPQLPVAAHGATSSAYRRWVDDAVRELREAAETAASAAGGS